MKNEYSEVKHVVLNRKQSFEKGFVVPEADPLPEGAGDRRGTLLTRTASSTGVADRIELYRDMNTNQASSGKNKALGGSVADQSDSSRVRGCNVRRVPQRAPGRGMVSGPPQRLAEMRGNARGGKDPGRKHSLQGHVMRTPEAQTKTDTKLERIAWLSSRDEQKVFKHLMHLYNEESLKGCFHKLDGKKAVGTEA